MVVNTVAYPKFQVLSILVLTKKAIILIYYSIAINLLQMNHLWKILKNFGFHGLFVEIFLVCNK